MRTSPFDIVAALMLIFALGGCGASPSEMRSSFAGPQGLRFDTVIESPPESVHNGWAVLMIGGGLGNDLDWITPGALEIAGQRSQVTLTGEPHADAPRISAAMASKGFTVMRWSTIAHGDPLADQWPVRATPRTLAELMEQTRAALAELRRQPMVQPDRVILLGFSLGAARACTIAAEDDGVAALVLLSPAYFTRPEAPPASFEANGMRFGSEVLEARPLPCLLVFGELDLSRSVDQAGAEAFAQRGGAPDLKVVAMPGLGHQLGPQDGGLMGPIDERVLQMVADWAAAPAVAGAGAR